MLRVGLKFPVNGVSLNRIKKNGCEKLYLTTRCFETSSKPQKENRLFKDVTLVSRLSGHRYSTESKSERGRGSTGALATIGVLTIGTLGILTYAKNDKDFRNTLEGWIPGTDKVITIMFQEEDSYFENMIHFFSEQKQKIIGLIFGRDSDKPAPRPAFTPPALELSPPAPEKPKPEIRVSKEQGKIEVVAEKPPSTKEDLGNAASDLLELEKYAGEHATKAIAAFKEAACAAQEFNAYIVKVVESTDATAHSSVWEHLKKAQEKKTKAVEEAEKTAQEALRALKQIHKSIDNPDVHASYAQKTIAKKNIDKILSDVDEAKGVFNQELANANISEKYWKNVKAAREKFQEELKILFPNINIYDKKFQVSDDAFDLFVLHMYHKVDFLQKELDKLQTLGDHKLRAAIKSGDDKEKIEEAICLEVVKERRRLEEEYEKKMLEIRKVLDEEMRKQLKLQAQIHADHLRDALAMKDREMERKVTRALSEQKEKEATDHKTQLAAVIGRLRGLDEALKNRLEAEKDASEAQLMWGACQALVRAVRTSPPGTSPAEALRPLGPEISAIKRAAPKDDAFVNVAISGIPEEAVKRGVYPEDALRERFLKVERMARKLALVPEEGASLPIYLLSYLQNFLLVKAVSPIPKHELDDQPIDAQSLDTYDVLQRARYWLDRGDLKMTLRYMNLLKGAPRAVSRDWMNEARIHLETKQAIDSLVAYAGANSLIFMGGGDKKKK